MTSLTGLSGRGQERRRQFFSSNIESDFKGPSDSLASASTGLYEPNRMLLVDADPKRTSSLFVQLQQLNAGEIEAAEGAIQALDMIQSKRYAMIVWDERSIGGAAEAAAEIRRSERDNVRPPVSILMAAAEHTLLKDRQAYQAAGINDFIQTPVRLNDLNEIVHRWLMGNQPRPGLLNMETVQELIELDEENHDMIPALLELFRKETPKKIQKLQQLLEEGEYRLASEVAHSLKSGSLSMGLSSFAKMCEEIERACLKGSESENILVSDNLKALYEASCSALEQVVN